MKEKRKCKSCIYRTTVEGQTCCQYILVTGHMRKCPIVGCTKYEKGKPELTMDAVKKQQYKQRERERAKKEKELKKNKKKLEKLKKKSGTVSDEKRYRIAVILTDPEGKEHRVRSKKEMATFLGKSYTAMVKSIKRAEEKGENEVYGYKYRYEKRD